MAITGVSSISGEQIIAAGAVSARSAATALYDENGNAITSYLTAVPEGYATTGDLNDLITSISETYQPTAEMTAYQSAGDYYSASNPSGFISEVPDTYLQNTDLTIIDGKISEISGVPLSAGSTPAYGYTDNGLISSIDTSGLYATSASTANNAKYILTNGTMGKSISYYDGSNQMFLNPYKTPFGTTSGIYGPLQYATGAVITYGSSGGSAQYFGGFLKGNEWYVSNATAGQALRGETHGSRGVHISGATTAGYGFDLSIKSVSGVNSTGSWKYGHNEDAALRAVSSCDMHESAFGYDANDKISGYNGSAFAGEGGGGSNVTTANTGNDYNINVDGLDVYGTVTTKSEPAYEFDAIDTAYKNEIASYWDNFQFDNKIKVLQSATKVIFTLYNCDHTYWPSDSLEFNVLFSARGFDSISYTNINYSALIGNIKMDITGNYPPPAGEIRVLTCNLDIPSAMKEIESFSIDSVGIGFSGDFGEQVGNQRWSAEAGYDEITGTSSTSGIYIPNINDITAMSASIGDVETLLASL